MLKSREAMLPDRQFAPPPQRVCIITEAPGFGGTEVHTLGIVRMLLELGHPVHLVSCRHHQYDTELPERYHSLLGTTHTDLSMNDRRWEAGRRWAELLRSLRCQIVLIPKGGNNVGNLAFLFRCRIVFAKVVLIEHLEAEKRSTVRGPKLPTIRQLRTKLVKRARAACADTIITVSEKVARRLTEDWGLPAARIAVVRNGVDWRLYRRDVEAGMVWRRSLGIPDDAFTFGMVTRLVPAKAVDIALRAFQSFQGAEKSRRAVLIIVGTGPLAEALQALAYQLGIAANVRFLGFIRNVSALLSGIDSIVFSSRAEGLPLALLEAMAAGCIPLVTDVGGMPEAVDAPALGWVVPPEDISALSCAMRSVSALEARGLRDMRRAVVQRIQQDFDLYECHRRILDLCGLRGKAHGSALAGSSAESAEDKTVEDVVSPGRGRYSTSFR